MRVRTFTLSINQTISIRLCWQPSATLGPDNRVYLYGNCATCGEAIVRDDLGFNGLSPSSRAVVQLPRFYQRFFKRSADPG